jgi:hypothetical protein
LAIVGLTFFSPLPGHCGLWHATCGESVAFKAPFAIMYGIGITGLWITVPVMIYRLIRFRTIAAQPGPSQRDNPN